MFAFKRLLMFFVAALGLAAVPALAQKQTLAVDPARSEVHFHFKDTLHAVQGTFRVQSGEVIFDAGERKLSGLIVVDAASGQSGSEKRDRKMSAEELKADSFRAITFAPKTYTGTLVREGDSEIVVHGVFTLLNTPHAIDVPMKVHLEGGRARVAGSFVVPYVQWGLKDPSIPFVKVEKEVAIDLALVGALQ